MKLWKDNKKDGEYKMTEEEIAEALDVTVRTVQRDWVKARLLLRRALEA